jgi:hypothetical protein
MAQWAETPGTWPGADGLFPMPLTTLFLILVLLLLIGALPTWPHSRSWGYYPSGGLGLVLVVLLVFVLLNRV